MPPFIGCSLFTGSNNRLGGRSFAEGSVAFFREPACSSSVLSIKIGEVGDSVA